MMMMIHRLAQKPESYLNHGFCDIWGVLQQNQTKWTFYVTRVLGSRLAHNLLMIQYPPYKIIAVSKPKV